MRAWAQDAADLGEKMASAWSELLSLISGSVPEDAAGHAFRALQATHAVGAAVRKDAVALLATCPGEALPWPHLAALNPFLQKKQGPKPSGARPRWTEHRGEVPPKLLGYIKRVVQLQGFATCLCSMAREFDNAQIGATLQRQVADLLEPTTEQWSTDRGHWLQMEWEQSLTCRPIQLEVAQAMLEGSFDRQVLQLNMGEGKSKVILHPP